ncbi:MAG: phosphoribosyltransferase family protein [Thermoprotei archaeon]
MNEVCIYKGQKYYTIGLFNLIRKLPIVPVDDDIWIASDAELVLEDTEFISRAAQEIAETIKPLNPDIIITPEAKSIALTYEISKNLNHKRFVVARKSVKGYMKEHIIEQVRSITTKEEQMLVLNLDDINLIKDHKVCIFDDVVSTGGTIKALESLVKKAEGKIVCKISIWREGPWYKTNDLLFFDILPIFVSKKLYNKFIKT